MNGVKTNVFINSGGIGGLTLGVKLAQKCIKVTMIEKLPGSPPVYKGEIEELYQLYIDLCPELNGWVCARNIGVEENIANDSESKKNSWPNGRRSMTSL